MSQPSYIPAGFSEITPYLIVSSSAELIDFVKKVFQAEEVVRMHGPEGQIVHAQVKIGSSALEMADAREEWPAMPGSLHVYVPEIDGTYVRALEAGASVLAEPQDQFYGERSASVRDPLGNVWHIATKTEDLSLAEMKSRAEKVRHTT